MEINTVVMFILRWIHLFAGITWIGLLYFFNFINGIVAKTFDAETKKKVVPELMPRCLFFFRWAAMVTFLTGWIYIVWKIFVASDAGLNGPGGLFSSTWGQWITIGGTLGTVMWFNVWFVIWPAQKRIIRWIKSGEKPAQMAGLVAKATGASKINTYLSVPLLFCMAAATHLPVINPALILGAFVIGFAAVFCIYKESPKIKTET
jgi:uncharacterized membrane protein